MIERYSDKNIKKIFSRKNRLDIFLNMQKELVKYLSTNNIDKIEENFNKVDLLKLSEDAFYIEEEIHHEMASFVDALELQLPEYSGLIHRGLTSSDVLDTTFSLQIRECIEYTLKDVKKFIETFERKKSKYKNILISGRTHGQVAEPLYIDHLFENYIEMIERCCKRLENVMEELPIKASGPVGNFSNISNGFETSYAILKDMNQVTTTQVISRDFYADVIHAVCMLASVYEKIAIDIRIYSQTGINEMAEGFSDSQKGSSAMPHKKNPILSENITGLSRLLRSYIGPAYENITLWGQRDMSHSSVERVIYEDAFMVINFMTKRMDKVINDLYINESNIEKNIDLYKISLSSHSILVDLMKKGMARSDAYKKVQDYVMNKTKIKDLTLDNITNIISLDRFRKK
jgi:adenylosuccinate lyase